MKQKLGQPVEFGDVRLAPTVELAGLAELADLRSNDERVEALVRIAEAVRADDEAREHLRRLRSGEVVEAPLPQRAR